MSKQAPLTDSYRTVIGTHLLKGVVVRKFLEIGGYIAAVVPIAFGVGAVYTGLNARGVVQDTSARRTSSARPT